MSFQVLVVPEDPTLNGYILCPLAARMLRECGKPKARVTVLTNPRATGYQHAKKLLADEVLDRYAHVDLILFLPDADGKDRSGEFEELEAVAARKGAKLLCCAAVEEVETWLLAGHLGKVSRSWREIRADRSVKEADFEPFLAEHGDSRRAGGGREALMRETLRNYRGLLDRCLELARLEQRVVAMLEGRP